MLLGYIRVNNIANGIIGEYFDTAKDVVKQRVFNNTIFKTLMVNVFNIDNTEVNKGIQQKGHGYSYHIKIPIGVVNNICIPKTNFISFSQIIKRGSTSISSGL